MKKLRLNLNKSIIIMITAFCILATLLQGIPALSFLSRDTKMFIFTGIFLFTFILLIYFKLTNQLTEESTVFAIIFLGMLFHLTYVVLSGLYERQHDEGVYTGIATDQINPGHLGYIEYIYKFRKLPDMNPYQLFSYYHPPLHYALSGLWLIFLTALGMPEEFAFENLQVLPLFYSGIFMFLTYLILKKIGAGGKGLYAGLILVALHPALAIMSGSINNDMLSCVLLASSILFTLYWLQNKSLKTLIPLALSIGFGMLCKINTTIIAFPVGLLFLVDFIRIIRSRNRNMIRINIRNYCIFGFVSAFTGLSWIIRNLILFHVKPGISSATESSIMYTGDYSLWARIGIPAISDWHFTFPFHPLSGDVIHNTWVIMFQTSLFAEVFPAELKGITLFLCQAAYLSAILFATLSAILFIVTQIKKWNKKTGKEEAIFLLTGYLIFISSFLLFALKYPYTCSSDFRYIVICLVYTAVGLSDSAKLCNNKTFSIYLTRFIRIGVCVTLLLTTLIYMTWKQW